MVIKGNCSITLKMPLTNNKINVSRLLVSFLSKSFSVTDSRAKALGTFDDLFGLRMYANIFACLKHFGSLSVERMLEKNL